MLNAGGGQRVWAADRADDGDGSGAEDAHPAPLHEGGPPEQSAAGQLMCCSKARSVLSCDRVHPQDRRAPKLIQPALNAKASLAYVSSGTDLALAALPSQTGPNPGAVPVTGPLLMSAPTFPAGFRA